MSRIHPWNCWGLIIASWAVMTALHYHTIVRSERVVERYELMSGEELPDLPERNDPTPPRVLIAFACAAVALLLVPTLCRRGRAWLRMRPRLSRPSAHGHVYLEGFALRSLLGCLLGITSYLLLESTALIMWHLDLYEAAAVLMSLAAVGYAFRRCGSTGRALAEWGWIRGRVIWREIAIGLLAGVLSILVRYVPHSVDTIASTPVTLASILIFAPIVEETFYRGMLYRYLRDRWRWPMAVVISAAVFAAMHLPFERWPSVFIAGVVYALLREWRRSLLAPVAAHFASNLLAISVHWDVLP